MGQDEQKEEREVLDAIFPEEITGTRRKHPAFATWTKWFSRAGRTDSALSLLPRRGGWVAD
jgi:hypothetical protein